MCAHRAHYELSLHRISRCRDFYYSHMIPQKSAHLLSRVLLHLGGDMSVGIQGERRAVMPQQARQGLHIHAVLQRQRREGMPLRYNYDKPEMPRISKGFWDCQACFSSFSKPKNRAAK